MRAAILAMSLCLAGPSLAAPDRTVDLGDSATLDAIARRDPQRYEKIMRILQVAGDVSCEMLPQVLQVQHGAKDVQCTGALILTSYPPKRHLRFGLEDTIYVVNVVLNGPHGTLQPAR